MDGAVVVIYDKPYCMYSTVHGPFICCSVFSYPLKIKVIIPKLIPGTPVPEFEVVFRKFDPEKQITSSSSTFTIKYPFKKKILGNNNIIDCETKEDFWFTRKERRFYYSTVEFSLESKAKFICNDDKKVFYDVSIKQKDKYYHKFYCYFNSLRKQITLTNYCKFTEVFIALQAYYAVTNNEQEVLALYTKCSVQKNFIEIPLVQLLFDGKKINFSNIPEEQKSLDGLNVVEILSNDPFTVSGLFTKDKAFQEFAGTGLHVDNIQFDLHYLMGASPISLPDTILEQVYQNRTTKAFEEMFSWINIACFNLGASSDCDWIDRYVALYTLTKPIADTFRK